MGSSKAPHVSASDEHDTHTAWALYSTFCGNRKTKLHDNKHLSRPCTVSETRGKLSIHIIAKEGRYGGKVRN